MAPTTATAPGLFRLTIRCADGHHASELPWRDGAYCDDDLDQCRRHAGTRLLDNVEAYAPGNPIFAVSADDHLTASSAADLLVFAQPIANDLIHNFDAAADKIDLIGFPASATSPTCRSPTTRTATR